MTHRRQCWCYLTFSALCNPAAAAVNCHLIYEGRTWCALLLFLNAATLAMNVRTAALLLRK